LAARAAADFPYYIMRGKSFVSVCAKNGNIISGNYCGLCLSGVRVWGEGKSPASFGAAGQSLALYGISIISSSTLRLRSDNRSGRTCRAWAYMRSARSRFRADGSSLPDMGRVSGDTAGRAASEKGSNPAEAGAAEEEAAAWEIRSLGCWGYTRPTPC
jgi:hypothetical protein